MRNISVICSIIWVCDRHPGADLAPAFSNAERLLVYRWIVFAAGNNYATMTRVNHPERYTSEESCIGSVRAAAAREVDRQFRSARGHVGLGWSRIVTGQHDSALESLARAVEVNPSFGQGYIYLGLAQTFCGLTEEARISANAAMRLSPKIPLCLG